MVDEEKKQEEVVEKKAVKKEAKKADAAPAKETKAEVKEEKKPKKASSKKAKKDESEKKPAEVKEEKKPKAKTTKSKKKDESKEEKETPEKKTTSKKAKAEKKEEVEEAPKEEKKKTASKKTEVKKAPVDEVKTEKKKKEVVEAPTEEVKETPVEETKTGKKEEEVVEAPEEAPKREKKKVPNTEDLIFGKYNTTDVVVEDPSLEAHINLEPAYVPHSSARHANKPFHKSKISIVERLVNSIMRTERYTGKKTKSYKAVLEAFQIINERTKTNPVQVLVQAIENSAPREEVTRLKFGGISVPKAVDTGPSRRLDIALRNISIGSVKSTHKNRKSIALCLANELISASKGDVQSYAVSKRDEAERVAKSAH